MAETKRLSTPGSNPALPASVNLCLAWRRRHSPEQRPLNLLGNVESAMATARETWSSCLRYLLGRACALLSAPDGRVSHGMACCKPFTSILHLLLGHTSPALMFASARKRDLLNDAATSNKESTDDYFLCLITYKYTVTKNRFQIQKLQLSDSPELVSSFKSLSFLLRHMHFYLLLYFYHWTPPTLSRVIIIRHSSVFVADYIFRPCSGNKS